MGIKKAKRARAYGGEEKLKGEDNVQASPNYKARSRCKLHQRGEQRSRRSTFEDIYSLPLQGYLPSNERSRSRFFDLTKGGERKRRELEHTGEKKSSRVKTMFKLHQITRQDQDASYISGVLHVLYVCNFICFQKLIVIIKKEKILSMRNLLSSSKHEKQKFYPSHGEYPDIPFV
ncbi:hypothetical protein Tco_1221773 [Tanacetum coccineum]